MFGVVVPGEGEVGFSAGGVVPGVLGVVDPGVVESGVVVEPGVFESGDPGAGVVCGVSLGLVSGAGVVLVFGVVPGVVESGFWFVGAGVGAAVPGAGAAVPGVVVCPGVVCPAVPWLEPAGAPAVPAAPPVEPAVCRAAISTGA